MISHTVILSVLINLQWKISVSVSMISHTLILSILINLLEISVSMISHTLILSLLINLMENISQYDISHSDIVSINKPSGKYQSV